jgi:hypothetical protein
MGGLKGHDDFRTVVAPFRRSHDRQGAVASGSSQPQLPLPLYDGESDN